MFDDDTPSRLSSPGRSGSDHPHIVRARRPQARETPKQDIKKGSAIASLPEDCWLLILKGGEKLRAHLAEFNAIAKAAASTDLQNLHLAIGAQYLRFLPKFDDIRYDETTDVGEYLPI